MKRAAIWRTSTATTGLKSMAMPEPPMGGIIRLKKQTLFQLHPECTLDPSAVCMPREQGRLSP